ncbi:HNH endonuclease family protein [uncultured Rothia sp.]|uniref:HNH endonuclease family protein n=1 Tax=uncultured Rothia sp. TaxID=316088 RepID=UPI0032171245
MARTSFRRTKLPLKVRFYLSMIALAVLVVGLIFWWGKNGWDWDAAMDALHSPATPVSTGFSQSGVSTYSTASDVLETLKVREDGEATGYSRELYGKAWRDVDSNGCDQRNDILTRDLQNLTRDKNCKVVSGDFIDPYTGESVQFQRGEQTSHQVPIDHVVALSNAWQTGATLLSETQRAHLANDPLNLQATTSRANTQKSDADASAWLPQRGYQCEYVARQVSVKAVYHLWVSPSEKQAMEKVLKTCPEQPAYRSSIER